VPHNHLPKTPLGGIHLSETKRRFLEGTLHPVNVLMCPHTCVTNLPKPREVHSDVGPASVIVGNLVQVIIHTMCCNFVIWLKTVFRIRFGSGFSQVSGSGSVSVFRIRIRIQEGKTGPTKVEKIKKLHVDVLF
jgi:hypothetical protein